MNRRRKRFSISLVVICILLGGTAGAAIALSSSADPSETAGAAAPVQQVDPQLTADLSVLRRPRTSHDDMSGGNAQAASEAGARAGVNLALSRKVTVDGTDVYVIPGDGQVCISSPGAGSCADSSTIDELDAVHYGRIPLDDPPNIIRFVGLVPDSVTAVTFVLADGSTADAALNENVFKLVVHQAPLAIVYRRDDGTTRVPLNQEIMQTLLPPAGSAAADQLQREYQRVKASLADSAK